MLFKVSNLNSNLALTLSYLNPALNNSAQGFYFIELSTAKVSFWVMNGDNVCQGC